MSKKWSMGIAALALALAAGCASPNTSGITVGAEMGAAASMERVLLSENAKLARQLHVDDLVVGQTKNGLMKADVKLTSRQNKSIVAQSKFAWFDAAGAEIDPDTDAWQPLVLHGKETRTVRGIAPNAAAASFKLRVRAGEKTRWIIK